MVNCLLKILPIVTLQDSAAEGGNNTAAALLPAGLPRVSQPQACCPAVQQCCGAVLCFVEGVTIFLASTYQMPVVVDATPRMSSDITEYLQGRNFSHHGFFSLSESRWTVLTPVVVLQVNKERYQLPWTSPLPPLTACP